MEMLWAFLKPHLLEVLPAVITLVVGMFAAALFQGWKETVRWVDRQTPMVKRVLVFALVYGINHLLVGLGIGFRIETLTDLDQNALASILAVVVAHMTHKEKLKR